MTKKWTVDCKDGILQMARKNKKLVIHFNWQLKIGFYWNLIPSMYSLRESTPPATAMNLEVALLEMKEATRLFFNNQFDEAKAMMEPW